MRCYGIDIILKLNLHLMLTIWRFFRGNGHESIEVQSISDNYLEINRISCLEFQCRTCTH